MNHAWNITVGIIAAFLMMTVLIGSRNTDSMKNCSESCQHQMLSYTEAKIELSGERFRIIPVCTCTGIAK